MYQEFEEEKNLNFVFYILVVFAVLFFAWLYFTSMDRRIKGVGTVIPSTNKQIIEATNSGAVIKIFKKEGDILKKGDSVVLIDPTTFEAGKEQVKGELEALKMKLLRLSIESNPSFLRFDNLPKKYLNSLNKKYFESENETFKLDQKLIKQKIKSAQNKIILKRKEIGETQAKIKKLKKQIKIAEKKLKLISSLVKAHAYSKVEYLDLKSKLVDLKGELEVKKENLKKINADIKLLDSNKEEIIKKFNSNSSSKIGDIKSKIAKLKEQLVIESSKVSMTLIKSPVSGYLNKMYVHNTQDMVKVGDVIAEVVPTNSSLIISTKIAPKDIAFLKIGQRATIKLSAYDYTIYGFLYGSIIDISQDVFLDKRTNQSYYLIKIKSDKNYIDYKGKKLKIIPGMMADVDVIVGKRTLFEYIFLPILKVLDNAGVEK